MFNPVFAPVLPQAGYRNTAVLVFENCEHFVILQVGDGKILGKSCANFGGVTGLKQIGLTL